LTDQLVFRSKVDLWLLVLLMLAVAACLVVASQYWDAVSARFWWVGLLLAAGMLLPLWILFSLRYFMSDTQLRVRCGPFNWTIEIADIAKVAATDSAASAPALSLDRLRIDYASGRSVMISPEPRHEFVRQLEHRMQRLRG
jgi:hypothetical protein